MQPITKSWYYWTMAGLLLAQVVLSVNYHVLVCNMPIANTLLLLIIMAHHCYTLGDQARPLFHRICGCVAFIAVLFVNTTHALELLTDYGDDHGHSHSVNPKPEHDHVHDHVGYVFIPEPYVFVSIFDIILKVILLFLGYIPSMGLPLVLRIVLHTLSPATVIVLYVLGLYVPVSIGESWLWGHIDPITAVLMTLLFIGLIYPAFREMMPYVFADTPRRFEEDSFQNDISLRFNDVTCSHIHAYRLWPGNLFEALIHINIKVDKQQLDWSEKAALRFEEVRQNVHSVLTKAGAQRVIMEPRFIDVTEDSSTWVGCVEEKCHRRDRGCCGRDAFTTIQSEP